jgi:hypothetical protein
MAARLEILFDNIRHKNAVGIGPDNSTRRGREGCAQVAHRLPSRERAVKTTRLGVIEKNL